MARRLGDLLIMSDAAVAVSEIAGIQPGFGPHIGYTFVYLKTGTNLRTQDPVEDVLDALEGIPDPEETAK